MIPYLFQINGFSLEQISYHNTYGFVIGETSRAQTPIAVSGRVLAYPYEPRDTFSAGDAVCSGPNGTVSKMTREERMKKLQNYGEIKIKTDCFAYKESNEGLIPKKECSALTDLFCKKEKRGLIKEM